MFDSTANAIGRYILNIVLAVVIYVAYRVVATIVREVYMRVRGAINKRRVEKRLAKQMKVEAVKII